MTTTHHFHSEIIDNPWPEVLDRWMPYGIQCLWPKVHAEIDWDKPLEPVALESLGLADADTQSVNLLYKVCTQKQDTCLLWIHFDNTQESPTVLAKKLFKLSCILHTHYDDPILPLVIRGASSSKEQPVSYKTSALTYATHQFEFQTKGLSVWQGDEQKLIESPNLFEKAIGIYLRSQTAEKDVDKRYQLKLAIHQAILKETVHKEDFLCLYTFMDKLIPLPESLSKSYYEEVYQLEKNARLNYLTDSADYGVEQWTQKGFERGMQHAKQTLLQNMVAQGIERSKIKKILNLDISDKEFNRLLIMDHNDHSADSPTSVTDSIDTELQTI